MIRVFSFSSTFLTTTLLVGIIGNLSSTAADCTTLVDKLTRGEKLTPAERTEYAKCISNTSTRDNGIPALPSITATDSDGFGQNSNIKNRTPFVTQSWGNADLTIGKDDVAKEAIGKSNDVENKMNIE
jgi:hypothetical protein